MDDLIYIAFVDENIGFGAYFWLFFGWGHIGLTFRDLKQHCDQAGPSKWAEVFSSTGTITALRICKYIEP